MISYPNWVCIVAQETNLHETNLHEAQKFPAEHEEELLPS